MKVIAKTQAELKRKILKMSKARRKQVSSVRIETPTGFIEWTKP